MSKFIVVTNTNTVVLRINVQYIRSYSGHRGGAHIVMISSDRTLGILVKETPAEIDAAIINSGCNGVYAVPTGCLYCEGGGDE